MDEIIQKDLQVPGGILMREEALLLALSVFISRRHSFFFFYAFICPLKQRGQHVPSSHNLDASLLLQFKPSWGVGSVFLGPSPSYSSAGTAGAQAWRQPRLCAAQALASSSSRNSLCIGTRPSCLMLQKCWTARAAVWRRSGRVMISLPALRGSSGRWALS